MSLPHECTCRICGGLMSSTPIIPFTEEQIRAQHAMGARNLASAIIKIAPEQAKAIAARWQEMMAGERVALEEFLTFLKQCS